MIATVFLSVMVLALVLGNVFLTATAPKKRAPPASGTLSGSPAAPQSIGMREEVERERVRMLNKRIDRLENLLLKINNSKFVAKKINGTNLAQKLNRLEEFRENSRLEIAALKQQVEDMQEKKESSPKEADASDINEEKVHNLIYRGGKNKPSFS